MENILANFSVSISELKKSPTAILKDAGDEAIAVLNHNIPSAYLVPSKTYERLLEIVDAYELEQAVKERLSESESPIEVSLDEL
ncbi:MAG TPA: antitoxin [Sulfurospirillum arcachonense]|nr:antitoxin [Sulfurospirillum arcachonense]HIP45199.1 antitoxin [Sulfurospirillum arcachonense]